LKKPIKWKTSYDKSHGQRDIFNSREKICLLMALGFAILYLFEYFFWFRVSMRDEFEFQAEWIFCVLFFYG